MSLGACRTTDIRISLKLTSCDFTVPANIMRAAEVLCKLTYAMRTQVIPRNAVKTPFTVSPSTFIPSVSKDFRSANNSEKTLATPKRLRSFSSQHTTRLKTYYQYLNANEWVNLIMKDRLQELCLFSRTQGIHNFKWILVQNQFEAFRVFIKELVTFEMVSII